jgi:hypothetical protein
MTKEGYERRQEGQTNESEIEERSDTKPAKEFTAPRREQVFAEQATGIAGDPEHNRSGRDRRREHQEAVDERSDVGVATPPCKTLGHELGGKRDRRNRHEEADIQQEQHAIRAGSQTDHGVVIDPHDPDHEKADRLGQVGRPLVSEGGGEGLAGHRSPKIQHKQGCRNGEDAVAKCLKSAGGDEADPSAAFATRHVGRSARAALEAPRSQDAPHIFEF